MTLYEVRCVCSWLPNGRMRSYVADTYDISPISGNSNGFEVVNPNSLSEQPATVICTVDNEAMLLLVADLGVDVISVEEVT